MRIAGRLPIVIFVFFSFLSAVNAQTVSDSSYQQLLAKYRTHYSENLEQPVGLVNDFEKIYTKAQKNTLDSLLGVFYRSTKAEIIIVTVDSFATNANDFDNLAFHILQEWGIGSKDMNNGMVICISAGRRRMRISNGFGMEVVFSDAETKKIISDFFIPEFKKANYFQGTLLGLKAIVNHLTGKLPTRDK